MAKILFDAKNFNPDFLNEEISNIYETIKRNQNEIIRKPLELSEAEDEKVESYGFSNKYTTEPFVIINVIGSESKYLNWRILELTTNYVKVLYKKVDTTDKIKADMICLVIKS